MTTSDLYALMPIIIPAAGSVLVLMAGAFRPGWYLYEIAGACMAASLAWSIFIPGEAVMAGMTVNLFSRTFIVVAAGCGLAGLLMAAAYNRRRGITGEEYPATLLFALTGMGAAVSANNLLMIFLGLEAFTFAFYLLVAMERCSSRGGEAGLKYLLNGTLAAAVMGLGMALIYCSRGTLRLEGLAPGNLPPDGLFQAGSALLLLGLAFKLSLVPAHLWTADVYQGAPAPVTALLSTASKAVSVAVLVLLAPLLLVWRGGHDLIWLLALASLLCGNLAALQQTSIKRMLAWSSIGQMGYVALALTALPSGGARAALFYAISYAVSGLAAFGAVSVLSGEGDRDAVDDYTGLGYRSPLAGAVLALAMFSLAGVPPAAGFMAKFAVFSAALKGGETSLAIAGAVTALVAAYFYLRIVVVLYMKTPEEPAEVRSPDLPEVMALALPAAGILLLGLFPQHLLELLSHLMP